MSRPRSAFPDWKSWSELILFKGGYVDFSHLTELAKYIYHWNLYEKKKKKKKIINN